MCQRAWKLYTAREWNWVLCYIDVYNKNGTISLQEVVETKPDKFVMTNSSQVYESLRIFNFFIPKSQWIDIFWKMLDIFGIWYILINHIWIGYIYIL